MSGTRVSDEDTSTLAANKRMQLTARLGFKRKAIAVMRLVRLVPRPASRSWGGIMPQLMRRVVRLHVRGHKES